MQRSRVLFRRLAFYSAASQSKFFLSGMKPCLGKKLPSGLPLYSERLRTKWRSWDDISSRRGPGNFPRSFRTGLKL